MERGFVIRNCHGDILMAGFTRGAGFVNAEVEEPRPCLFALQYAQEARFDTLIVEGDCLQLIQKLKSKHTQDSLFGLLVHDISACVR